MKLSASGSGCGVILYKVQFNDSGGVLERIVAGLTIVEMMLAAEATSHDFSNTTSGYQLFLNFGGNSHEHNRGIHRPPTQMDGIGDDSSPLILGNSGDSSLASAESSFRELDDVFLQTQTGIWLGEVLNIRLNEQLSISGLLADGELLFEVSRTLLEMLLRSRVELRYGKTYKDVPFASRKTSGRYTPYSNVDSFLKVCKILGLTGIDLFSPSDVVEKRNTRKVCMCIRYLSKKARAMHLKVPDFDIVTYSVSMPTEMVECIRKSWEQSRCSVSHSSSDYTTHQDSDAYMYTGSFGSNNIASTSENQHLTKLDDDDEDDDDVEVLSITSMSSVSGPLLDTDSDGELYIEEDFRDVQFSVAQNQMSHPEETPLVPSTQPYMSSYDGIDNGDKSHEKMEETLTAEDGIKKEEQHSEIANDKPPKRKLLKSVIKSTAVVGLLVMLLRYRKSDSEHTREGITHTNPIKNTDGGRFLMRKGGKKDTQNGVYSAEKLV